MLILQIRQRESYFVGHLVGYLALRCLPDIQEGGKIAFSSLPGIVSRRIAILINPQDDPERDDPYQKYTNRQTNRQQTDS